MLHQYTVVVSRHYHYLLYNPFKYAFCVASLLGGYGDAVVGRESDVLVNRVGLRPERFCNNPFDRPWQVALVLFELARHGVVNLILFGHLLAQDALHLLVQALHLLAFAVKLCLILLFVLSQGVYHGAGFLLF